MTPRWARALAEHETVVADFVRGVAAVRAADWHAARAPGKWSPAEEALHVTAAYELGAAAAEGRGGMARVVSPARAALVRTLLLPLFLGLRTFPRGAPAPRELRPDPAEARRLTPERLAERCRAAAGAAAAALHAAAARGQRVGAMHAYFGALPPLTTLRLLSAHTRHHAARLGRRSGSR